MTVDSAIHIDSLSKAYPTGFLHRRRRPVLRDLSLEVKRGEIFGFLGPNGAGKTTTIKILLGLVFPDGGSASVLGLPLSDPGWKARTGFLPEHPYFYDYLTPLEYLDYAGRLCGLPASRRRESAMRLLERVALHDARNVPVRRFSKGMAQRLGLAQALVNDPELVVLDEPMSGLDPFGRRLVRDVILDLRRQGKTVFFSTHILPDAESLCDRVALLRHGSVVKSGRLDEILEVGEGHVEVLASGGAERGGAAGLAISSTRMGERSRYVVPQARLVGLLAELEKGGARILAVSPLRQSLEDYFVQEMGQEPRVPWADLG
jgi:ABC-2 type transport system ATP-binding protein